MDSLSVDAAAAFLEHFAAGLSGKAASKWTGEFDAVTGTERRLVSLAYALRKVGRGLQGGLNESDAQFLMEQAEALRSPNRLSMEGPSSTGEWRLKAEAAMNDAGTLEEIAGLIRRSTK